MNMKVFEFNTNNVRVTTINGEPWFVAKDVAEVLGYVKTRNAIATHVDDYDKTTAPKQGGGTDLVLINESGLYSLIIKSKLESAKQFKRWVTSEVLPSIRKHGAYMTPQKIEEVLLNPDVIINLATQLKEQQAHIEQQNQIIDELKPKIDYMDMILQSQDLVSVNQIAADYGLSAFQLNKILNDAGVQYKQSGQWLLYAKYRKSAYTMSETVDITKKTGRSKVVMNTKWTQKGRLFIHNLLAEQGIHAIADMQQSA